MTHVKKRKKKMGFVLGREVWTGAQVHGDNPASSFHLGPGKGPPVRLVPLLVQLSGRADRTASPRFVMPSVVDVGGPTIPSY